MFYSQQGGNPDTTDLTYTGNAGNTGGAIRTLPTATSADACKDTSDKLNSFQLILIDRSNIGAGDFDIEMNYGPILWETGDASGGFNGFGGFSARAGYSNGVNQSFEFPGSAVSRGLLDSNTSPTPPPPGTTVTLPGSTTPVTAGLRIKTG